MAEMNGANMADARQLQFHDRLSKISDRHSTGRKGFVSLKTGYMPSGNHDGLMIPIPGARAQSSRIPYRGLFWFALATLLFKGFLYSQLGPGIYEDRVTRLQEGTVIEQVGAYAMKADPVTILIGEQIAIYLK